ncbi:MAG: molybdenum cofactor biosynthesis protein MoeB [Gemmatimonas sp.]|nr:molybdenum cofactor biosynthesis protein MoeB [Gemmatimonas sp.]
MAVSSSDQALWSRRYARQVVLKGFGAEAQQRLLSARVCVVGVGGLGSPAAMYLAAAGVGQLTLIDEDVVDESNLHRQLLFTTPDVGHPKLEVAAARLRAINPDVQVVLHHTRLNAENAAALTRNHDVVLDATDNFPTRYALNDACLAHGMPLVYGSVARFEGQVSVFAARGGPCYRCLFPEMPAPGTVPTCAEEGVLGVVPGIVGLMQATEVIKLITQIGEPLVGQLLLMDLLTHDQQRIGIARRAGCAACGSAAAAPSHRSPTSSTSRPMVQQLTPAEVAALLAGPNPPVLVDVREAWEVETAQVAGSAHLPLNTLPQQVASLNPSRTYALLCHHGMRSEMAANWLAQQGFTSLINVQGGIDAWSLTVDPGIPRY